MKRKTLRLYIVLAGMLCLGAAVALVMTALEENVVFFMFPGDLKTKSVAHDRRIRIGGVVADNSVARKADGVTVEFGVTDFEHTVAVVYRGILPDLFREGQGVVAEGKLGADGVFRADEVLAKHDETYMPPDVAERLKKNGQWRGSPKK